VREVGEASSSKSLKKIVSATVAVWPPLVPVTVKFRGLELVAERPLTVKVLLSPALIVDGSNVQAPVEQESTILSVKELAADA
jgi:hypothetical protein